MNAGVHDPVFRSKVSEWLGPPAIRIKMQFLAVPIGLTAALAMVSIGLPGSRK
jgi:hypothetical protein